MSRKILTLIIVFAATLLSVLILRSVSRPAIFWADSGYRPVMGTIVHVVAGAHNEQAAQKCVSLGFAELVKVDAAMSDYDPNSELSGVNRNAFKDPIAVSEPLFTVLTESAEYSRLSDGAFDITVGPLVDLWRNAAKQNQKPTREQIESASAKVGREKLILDPADRTVRFAVDGMRLDLGGIAKGYSIDLAVKAMKNAGALGGMVDVGGEVRCFGTPTGDKKEWVIGMQDPEKEGNILLKLKLRDMTVATSGDYRRYLTIDGQKYSHIMDPAAGSSARKYAGVTIIAPTGIQADALSTAVSVMDMQKGLAFIESIPSVEAIIIPHGKDRNLIKTSGADSFIIKENNQ